MNECQFFKNLSVPQGIVDVVLDTDAYNEVDDQFAIAYLLRSKEKLNTKAIYAAPFFNEKSENTSDGMKKSYNEIINILNLADERVPVFFGAEKYLEDENSAVVSDAAMDLVNRAAGYSPENPLYVVCIGAITNLASALILKPEISENIVVVWLGGHALHYKHTKEFNMYQDIAAARVVMKSGVPFVQLPCMGVVSAFLISKSELECWFLKKNKLTDYLAKIAIRDTEKEKPAMPWSRCLWDVTAIGWLLNDSDRFMESKIIATHLPGYDNLYTLSDGSLPMRYVYHINRDELLFDMIQKLTK